VTVDVIRQAVAEKTGIPLAQMNEGERERLVAWQTSSNAGLSVRTKPVNQSRRRSSALVPD